MADHLRPMFIKAHLEGVPFTKVMVDEGAAINVLPAKHLHRLGKTKEELIPTEMTVSDFAGGINKSYGILPVRITVGSQTICISCFVVDTNSTYHVLLGRDYLHQSMSIASTMHQQLLQWDAERDDYVLIEADPQPFLNSANALEAVYYEPETTPFKVDKLQSDEHEEEIEQSVFGRREKHGVMTTDLSKSHPAILRLVTEGKSQLTTISDLFRRLQVYWQEKKLLKQNEAIKMAEFIMEDEGDNVADKGEIIDLAPSPVDSSKPEVQDPLEEINLGTEKDPRPTFISGLLDPLLRTEIIGLLHEFKDCFAWHYHEMPGLDRNLVEHRLPIKEGYRPVKQTQRRISVDTELKVKEEIKRLKDAGFIRTAKYTEWLSNIVPVLKKATGAVRICVDYRNLNEATPKDEYPMPMADMLIDGASQNQLLSFMDGNAGYNQIMIAEEDIHKTAFRCPGATGAYEYVVMPFGLKNAGATYQRAMNSIFHDMIGQTVEVYIDDVVVKSSEGPGHVADLRKAFTRMKKFKLKMNPKKCAFGVQAGNFLGFLVHQRGIEVDKNKAKAIIDAPPPKNKKQLQSLLGKINFLRRFIANSASKVQAFSILLKAKEEKDFVWRENHEKAFKEIKACLASPPVMTPPKKGRPLKLYISASDTSIGSLLAQDNDEGKEQAIYYLSRILQEVETRYSPIERMCLALYFSAIKLRHYMLPFTVYIIANTDLIKYMLSRPILRGRLGKWTLALSEFNFQYVPQKAMKGQAVADFLAAHPSSEMESIESLEIGNVELTRFGLRYLPGPTNMLRITPWQLFFDGSKTDISAGAGIVIKDPKGAVFPYAFRLDFESTNNRAEYEALIIGLEILLELKVQHLEIFGDSQLVIKQLTNEYKCRDPSMAAYYVAAINLCSQFTEVSAEHIPREENLAANDMAQLASGFRSQESGKIIIVERRTLPSVLSRGMSMEVNALDAEDEADWRTPLHNYLSDPSRQADRRIRSQAPSYVLINEELLRKTADGLLLRCIGQEESMRVMAEIHEGTCGAHQAGRKMKWLIRRYGYFWPTMEKDCINYSKGCEDCQRNGPIQHVPAVPLNPIVKPWPFRGWAMDFIGKIRPESSKRHTFIVVATDYFTKWVEAKALRDITSYEVVRFIEDQIIYRFGIPETIVTDRGTSFMSQEVMRLEEQHGIRFVQSSPYFPQANGQAEATNKILISIIKRTIDGNPRNWHEKLSEALWAYRTSKRNATGITPFALTYGQDAVIPAEINVNSLRIARQHDLHSDEYIEAMAQEIENVDDVRTEALNHLLVGKKAVARAYNKRVKGKSFEEGEVVWKALLPLGSHIPGFGKWSPTWEGPYAVHKVLGKGAYLLKDRDGEVHQNPINGKWLKKFHPTLWDAKGISLNAQ